MGLILKGILLAIVAVTIYRIYAIDIPQLRTWLKKKY